MAEPRKHVGACTICGKPMMPWLSPLKRFRGRLAHDNCKKNWYRRMAWYKERRVSSG